MGRGRTPETNETRIRPRKSLSSSEAREKLPTLVREASGARRPAATLAARAVEIGPYNRGGAWLIPEIDAQAAIQRERELREQVAQLEEQLEDLALAELVRARLATASGRRMSGVEFIRSLGFGEMADELERG